MSPDPALVDFGDGRRLERLGGILVDRPHPAAAGRRARPELWREAAAVFEGDARTGTWRLPTPLPSPWIVTVPLGDPDDSGSACPAIRLHVHPAPSGQLGIFLEQMTLWRKLHATCTTMDGGNDARRRVLSLFAHTGGATIAMAAAGAEVFHVDASRQAIRTARDNAAASGLLDASIHWVEEDAVRYVHRLVRRGERFHGIVLDPPSWGHGPRGEAFSIDRDLEPLVSQLAGLLDADGFLLLTSHSPGWDARRLASLLAATIPAAAEHPPDSGPLFCDDASGRRLSLGWYSITASRSFGLAKTPSSLRPQSP